MHETRAYWVMCRERGELRAEPVARAPGPGHSLVQAELSGVSAGTERLVGRGMVPAACAAAMACRYMSGDFRLPVKYGYALIGHGVAGRLCGRRVFVMHPHQELAEIDDRDAVVLPDALPSARAALIPNTETALNAVWDAELEPGERVAVVGGGSVGLLLAHAVRRLHDRGADLVEADPARRALAAGLSFPGRVLAPEQVEPGAYRVAFHSTGRAAGLQLALDSLGFEGRVIELSWYGDQPVTVDLGSHFHFQRKRILASQVAAIAPAKRATHGFAERIAAVLELLADPELDRLLGAPVRFADMPGLMREVYAGRSPSPMPLVRYD